MIRQLLNEKDDSRTTLVISHRLGVTRLCDRVLVLDDGHLVENGTHADLLNKNGLYAPNVEHTSGMVCLRRNKS